MQGIVVRAYKTSGGNELLAVIPLDGMNHRLENGRNAADSELIAIAMRELYNQARFSAAEIESFRYKVDRPRYPNAPEPGSAPPPDAAISLEQPSDHPKMGSSGDGKQFRA
jgi:hypothetical protein